MRLRAVAVAVLVVVLAVVGLGGQSVAPSAAQEQAQEGGAKGEGTEDRDWVDGPADPPESMSPAQYGVLAQPIQVPMRDGATLDGVLYLPTRPPGEEAGPCVLFAEGYGAPSPVGGLTGATAADSLSDLATRGYTGAYVTLRTEDVPAEDALYYRYVEDGYDIVEWMAAQSWCDGNVGTIGASLNGISQWLPASATPPSLKAMVPEIGCGDCYWYLWYQGGTLPGTGREGRQPPVTAYNEYEAAIEHRDYDAWWQERNTDTGDHRAIAEAGIAVLQCGGWDDYIASGGMRAVEEITAAGGTGMHIFGPCSHGGSTPALVPHDLQTYRVLWFDRFLKGIDNGIGEGSQALIHVEGADQYRFEDEWPIPDTNRSRLHLRAAESGTSASRNDGSLSAAPADPGERSVSYEHSPDGPHNDAGGGGVRVEEDKREHEEPFLTWTTEPLTTPTEVTGWPSLSFHASSTAGDTDFVVELVDVAPDGAAKQVTRGWLNAPRSFDRTNPEPLQPGEVYRFDAELEPLSYVFQAGHRLRVMLSGSDVPGTAPNPDPATVTVRQDAAHPSYLELPLIGSAPAPGEIMVERLAGDTRFDTAVLASRRTFERSDVVVLARADTYADALAGGPLTAGLDAPMLLTHGDRLTGATEEEITRLGASEVVLLGGTAAIGPQVEARLEEMGVAVRRVAGANRFATAGQAAREMGHGVQTAFLVQGEHEDAARGWPDAVSAAPYAAHAGSPVLLVNRDRLPEETIQALADLDVEEVVVVGGPVAVSDAVVAELRDAGYETRRLSGATRYETSRAVYEEATEEGMDPDTVWMATGRDWPDALAAGPLVAVGGAAFALVDGHDLDGSPPTRALLSEDRLDIDRVVLLGGTAAISERAEQQVQAILAR